jgi:uncharacterized protein (TIGR02246 family)
MPKSTIYVGGLALLAFAGITIVAGAKRYPATSMDTASARATVVSRSGEDQDRQADREAIKKLIDEFIGSFNRGDAKTIASACTEHCAYYDEDSGEVFHGRAEVEKAYADLFKEQPGSKIEVIRQNIQFLSRDTALEEGTLRLKGDAATLPSMSDYRGVCVREDGQWRVALIQEWGGATHHLEELEWLIGDWTAKPPGREIEMKFRWNPEKTAILNESTIKQDGRVVSSGHQRIAIDPDTGQLNSWSFEADGGHGRSAWNRDGNQWVLESSGVAADGRQTSSLNLIARVSDDAFTWRSVNRVMGDQEMPDTIPIRVTRVKSGN